jgi:hypothetical protein
VPTWLIAPLIAAAALLAAWWAETKVTIIVTELKAIREGIDKLWANQSGEAD